MDIVHVKTTFVDLFSGSKTVKVTTVSKPTFDKMKAGRGTTFSHFDKAQQIRYNFKVENVEQA